MKKLTALVLFLFFPTTVFAASDVVINEFLPNGNPEWVEFYNQSANTIDLSKYYFDDDADFGADIGKAKFQLVGLLPPSITCFWDLVSFLNNDGDVPTIFKDDGTIIDTYSYTLTTQDKSFARIPDGGGWQTNQDPTKSPSSCLALAPSPTLTPSLTPTPPAPTSTIAPTDVPIPSPTPTTAVIATNAPTIKPTVRPTPTEEPLVLGDETSEPTVLPTAHETAENQTPPTFIERLRSLIPAILIVVGAALTVGSGIPLVIQEIRSRKKPV